MQIVRMFIQRAGLPADGLEVFAACLDAFHSGETHGGFVLFNNDVLCAGSNGCFEDRGHILHAVTDRTEFERGGFVVLFFFIDADESVEVLRELAAHVEVLEVNDRGSAVVLCDVFCGNFAADVDPAGVKFGFEEFLRYSLVEDIETVFAVNLGEFEVVA